MRTLRIALLSFIAAVVFISSVALAEPTTEKTLLAGLRPQHPRLLFTAEEQKGIEKLAETDRLLAGLIRQNRLRAEKALADRPCWYEIPDGRRLLGQSRRCIERILTMAMEYRLTGEKKYAEAVWREIVTVGKFKDWNPSHFLDTAEMTLAVAVGYDWIYDTLSDEQRAEAREIITRLGLGPGMRCYDNGGWWVRGHNNWNQVCNGGMLLGALAIAEDEPELAEKIVGYALESIPHGTDAYVPDGAYPEGPGYWTYGTSYTALTMMGLRTALGHDFDIAKIPALDKTGMFRVQMIGPTNQHFNYADGGAGAGVTPTVFALSRVYDQPLLAWWHRQRLVEAADATTAERQDRFFPLEIAWFDPRGEKPTADQLPTAAMFKGVQDVAVVRSDWDDPDAVFLGIKGGNNRANHGHLDIGSFVLDAMGVRWAIDLGSDNYNMPGYFGSKRWTYYRMINHSHNTLVIGDKIQNPSAVSPITDFSTDAAGSTTIDIDMTAAYKDQVTSAKRRAEMRMSEGKNPTVVMTDTLTGASEPVRWGFVTEAEIKLDGQTATLTDHGKTMTVRLESPADAKFQIASTKPPLEIERQNTGTRILAVMASPDERSDVTIRVTFDWP